MPNGGTVIEAHDTLLVMADKRTRVTDDAGGNQKQQKTMTPMMMYGSCLSIELSIS